jgi:hypothetical protein
MEKNENSCSFLRSLNLDDIEETIAEAYHLEGAGKIYMDDSVTFMLKSITQDGRKS